MSSRPHLIFDLEGNGLYHSCTKLHCAVTKDIITGEVCEYQFPGDEEPFKYQMSQAAWLCAHNGIDFDFRVLKKLWGWEPNPDTQIVDTLVMSRILNPDRPRVKDCSAGPHSVESWGRRLGRWKPDIEDWSTYTPEMLHRCAEDVEIQFLILDSLCREADVKATTNTVLRYEHDIFNKDNYVGAINWAECLQMEHDSAAIFIEQEENGVYFEKEKAVEHLATLDELIERLTDEIVSNIPPKPKQKGVAINEPFKINGEYKKTVLDWLDLEIPSIADYKHTDINGPFCRVWWDIINLNSDVQVKEWLFTQGWVPEQWNFHKDEVNEDGSRLRTSPKITEASLERLQSGLGRSIALRSKAAHRRNQIAGWIGHTRHDHRIAAEANPQGTPTGRARHRIVANVPKASSDKETHKLIWYPDFQPVFFGTEMRSLFSSGPDSNVVLVGRDASGLELRGFAHYINDPTYTEVILHGDIHSYNQELAGLETREQAKTFIYAFLYGAGDAKIGSIVLPDGSEEEQEKIGAQLKAQFLAANPKLEQLVRGVKKASGRGYLIGLDGRKLNMRRNKYGGTAKNKALNTLLQGAGAIIMTYARIWLNNKVKELKWDKDCLKVLDYHDEETYQCPISMAEDLQQIMVDSVRVSGNHFNLNIPLDAEARIGRSWADIH